VYKVARPGICDNAVASRRLAELHCDTAMPAPELPGLRVLRASCAGVEWEVERREGGGESRGVLWRRDTRTHVTHKDPPDTLRRYL
jgi:hypothetical protein